MNEKEINLENYEGYGKNHVKCQIENCDNDNVGYDFLPICVLHLINHLKGECLGNWKNE